MTLSMQGKGNCNETNLDLSWQQFKDENNNGDRSDKSKEIFPYIPCCHKAASSSNDRNMGKMLNLLYTI